MNRSEVKHLFLQGFVALLVLILPIFLLFMIPQLVLFLWSAGLILLNFKKQQNPAVVESKGYQVFEKLLYFQIINWSFGFFFVPIMGVITFIIPITLLVLVFNKERRAKPKFIKWAKYVGFHVFNLLLILTLLSFFPNVGEEGFLVMTIITFINGGNAAIYLNLEPNLPRGKKRTIALFIIIVMMISMALSMFPQYGGGSVFDTLFGG